MAVSSKGFLLFLVLFTGVFFLFSYNSGYGYDASEYLVIARLLDRGYPLYAIVPSKSYLIYLTTNWALHVLGGYNHVSVSALITLLSVGVVVSAWFVGRIFSQRAALLSAILAAICCFFMEMNFLEPESWVGILGLWAFYVVSRCSSGQETGNTIGNYLLAGLLLGIAMCFKSIAAFYVIGFGAFLLLTWAVGRQKFGDIFGKGSALLVGFAIPLIVSAGYFLAVGRLAQHLEWTYTYPLQGYPAHTLFLKKFLLKLSWFHSLLLIAFIVALRSPYRAVYRQTPALWLAILLGLCACIPLLKVQASHYFFPGAIFFVQHIAFLADRIIVGQSKLLLLKTRGWLTLSSIGLALLILGSIWLYRPDALQRLIKLSNYESEKQLGAFIRKQAGPSRKAILIDNGMMLYLLSECEPAVPFIHTEMQTTHYIKTHPNVYQTALADTSLHVVVFQNRPCLIDDSTTIKLPTNAYAIQQLQDGLHEHFRFVHDSSLNLNFWIR